MGIYDNFSGVVLKMGKTAKKTLDIRALNRRLKDYGAEEKESMAEIGRLYHSSKKTGFMNEHRLNELMENVDNLKFRVNQLNKQKEELLKAERQEAAKEAAKPAETRAQLLCKNDSDIRIRRTKNGIALVRICSECKTENPSTAEFCSVCMKKLKFEA
jgi:outer membrane murein-binding lipoprotein Lpp